ncbi:MULTISPECIES: lysylphosphatidylglycerol synthase transmembrane domain-containing protein [unclassified Polaribacter]|uniref:lysylphosphatidylglycerol synthase transmembrane domain-containing protein n=1 Tax=unclassified Polaribacter TaxID=196858 RepID=UPI000B80A1A3|nr:MULTISPECIES: lysylphosphatidylglycerol synthase transmembrane domain-containing protein [unclassified Polaribacter]MBT3742520.1 flippase-like domain-containing protein [Polaribacter sp.]MBT4412859.1 flippase-like domain-containing protein [Polaribacter sp.]MBT7817237.1 flippase-like domain-containing protein [Polaribacter sp.]MDG1404247.1 lysylphosphatidylglycerol synthase transmembrane domain-containing protein [Polaribacter sp.]MDG2436841.1 lysylphosphatidylglycerol synthase transmembran
MNIKKILKIILPLVLGGLLVWYSISKISIEILIDYFKEANYTWIFLGLFFGVLSHLSRAYRWKFMLDPLGFKPKFTNSVLAVLVGYLVNLAVPRAGEVSRALVLKNYEEIPFEKGFGTIVAERIADLIMMLCIILITLFVQFDFIYELLTKNFNPTKIIIGLAILIIAFYILTSIIKKAKSGFLLKIKTFVSGLIEGVTSIFKMKKKWAFIFHTLFIWAMYVAMFWATIPAIEGLEVPLGGILIGFIAGGFSIAATNGGIGLYPIAVAGALALFDIPAEPATAFGWIMWTAQTAMIIVFGGLAFLFLPIYNKDK